MSFLVRFALVAFPQANPALMQLLAFFVAITLIIANFSALAQHSLKRMLAYSAVAHAGYLGMAVLLLEPSATPRIAWYLTAYAFMNLGAFAILTLIANKDDSGDGLKDLRGLGRSHPFLALSFSIFLLALAGIPPLSGFFGKLYVFQAALEAGYAPLAVLAIITSVLAVMYYVRPIINMYSDGQDFRKPIAQGVATRSAIAISLLLTIVLGLFPAWWYGIVSP